MRVQIEITLADSDDAGWRHDEAATLMRRAADMIESGAWALVIQHKPESRLEVVIPDPLP